MSMLSSRNMGALPEEADGPFCLHDVHQHAHDAPALIPASLPAYSATSATSRSYRRSALLSTCSREAAKTCS